MAINLCRFEWKPPDLWIGAFWRRSGVRGGSMVDLWICLLPCVPLHLRWKSRRRIADAELDVPPIV